MATADEPPPERDVKDFRYQQLCRFQIAEGPSSVEHKSPQLLAASSKYGVFFVGTHTGFKVIKTAELSRIDHEHAKERTKIIVKEYPCQATVELSAPPTFMALSCDSLSLAVVIESADLSQVNIYDVRSFVSQGNQTKPCLEIRLPRGLTDLAWNPENPVMLVCVMEDGSISIFEAGDNLVVKATVSAQAKATCVCWSPKGKQLVVGQADGKLAQYDQALVKKKEWSCPSILSGEQKAVGLLWLSTFSFLVAYIAVNAETSDQPNVVLITGSKEAPVKYTPFEDPCFGNGEDRQKKFFFNYIPKWEVIAATSSTAIEVAVLGKHFDIKTDVERWNLDDAARAEIPLTAEHCEAYAMGVALDFSSQMPIPISDESSLPPCPILLVLSSDGILVPFYMIYTHPEAPALTAPPVLLSSEGARQPKASPTPGTTSNAPPAQPSMPAGPSFQFVSSKPAPSPTSSFSFTSASKAPGLAPVSGTSSQPKLGTQPSSPFSFTPQPSASTGFSFGTASSGTTPAGAATTAKPNFGTTVGGSTTFGSLTAPVAKSGSLSNLTASGPSSNAGTGSGFGLSAASTTNSTSAATNVSIGFGQTKTDAIPTATPASTQGQSSIFGSPLPSKSFPTTAPSSSSGFRLGSGSTPTSGALSQPASSMARPEPTKQAVNVQSSQSQPVAPVATEDNRQRPTFGQDVKPAQQETINAKSSLSQPVSSVVKEDNRQRPLFGQDVKPTQQENDTVGNLDSSYTHGIIEEMAHFEEELKKFRNRTQANRVSVGTVTEMEKLKITTEEITKFCDDIKNNTKEQTKEIEDIKSLVLDAYSMVEECRMREQRNADPKYIHLLRSKTLDPANQERLRSLQQKYQILDRGLRECDTILDNQWEEYQNKNRKHNRISNPTTDLIYRSIKSNKNVILHQKLELGDLESKLKQLRLYNKTSTWQDTLSESRSAELSSLADSLLESKTAPLSSSRITEPASPQKMAKLREHLSRRSVPRIKSTRPENLSMSRIVTADPSRSPVKAAVKTEPASSVGVPRQPEFTSQFGVLSQPESVSRFGVPNQPETVNRFGVPNQPETVSRFGVPNQPETVSRFGVPNQPETVSRFGVPNQQETVSRFGVPNQPETVSRFGVPNQPETVSRFGVPNQPETVSRFGVPNQQETVSRFGVPNQQETVSRFGVPQQTGHPVTKPLQQGTASSLQEQAMNLTGSAIRFQQVSQLKPPANVFNAKVSQPNMTFGDRNQSGMTFGTKSGMTTGLNAAELKFGETTTTGRKTIPNTGIEVEDITPPSSTGYEEDDETETETNDEDYDIGFGPQYNIQQQDTETSESETDVVGEGKNITSTPLSSVRPGVTKAGSSAPPSRNLFGTPKPDTTSASHPFGFGSTSKETTGFDFGGSKNDNGGAIPKISSGFSFTANSSVATSTMAKVPSSGSFNFSSANESAPSTFKFGQAGAASFGTGGTASFSSTKGASSGFSFSAKSGDMKTTDSVSSSTNTGGGDVQPSTDVAKATSNLSIGGTTAIKSKADNTSAASFSFSVTTVPSSTQTKTESGVSSVSKPTSSFSFTSSTAVTTVTGSNERETSLKSLLEKPVPQTSGSSAARSLFGSTTTDVGKPLFGQTSNEMGVFGQSSAASVPSSSTGLFGKQKEITTFEGHTVTSPSDSTPSTSEEPSVQSPKPKTPEVSSPNIGEVGQNRDAKGETTTTTGQTTGLFGQNVATSGGLFSQASGVGLFGKAIPTSSVLGQPSSSSGTSLFGQTSSATSSSSGLFGQSTTTVNSGLFGQPKSTTATTSAPASFGQSATTVSTQPNSSNSSENLFLQKPTSGQGLFGTTSSSSGGIFGQATTTSSSTGLFGHTTPSSGGLFGQTTTSGASSPFGQTSTSGGLFGQPLSSSGSGRPFGQPTSSSSGGLFGQTTSSSGGLFGQTVSTSSSSSPFGQSSGGLFGQKTATTSSGGLFGQTSSAPSTGIFGQPASSGSGLFGQSTTTSSSGGLFGQTPAFGMGQTTSASGFGQSAFGQTAFGQGSSSPFGQTATTSSSGFGNLMFGGLGGQPSAEKANTNVFGSTSFGSSPATSSAASLFGNQGNTTFGARTSGAFGGGSFSGGGGSVAASGFGVTTQQSSPSGFGGAPAFGSSPSFGGGSAFGAKPAFGTSPTFGGSAFGSQPTFGNPGVFGSPQQSQPTGGFAGFASSGSSPTFEALAGSSNVPTFGSLSQQGTGFGGSPGFGAATQQSPSFGGGFGSNPTGFGTTTPPNNPSFTGYRS